MSVYAIIDNVGLIVNRVVAEGGEWSPPSGHTSVEEAETVYAIGGTIIGGAYTPPPEPAPKAPDSASVNTERDRRIVAGKTINGVAVTGRDEDARNLTNLALAAQLRIASGDTTTTTTFRDGENIDHDLTPPEMLALWQASAAYVSALYAASWVIKAMKPIPADFDADARWPAI